MTSSASGGTNDKPLYKVRDPGKLAIGLFIMSIGLWVLYKQISHPDLPFVCLCLMVIIGAALFLKANWNGVVIDLNRDMVEVPGGGIAANDFSDYCKPKFLLQYFCRFKFNLRDISEIKKYCKLDSKGNQSHAMIFTGSFGSARIWFNSEGKRDQLYASIRQINNMGIPVIKG